jgi:hypothetical protein
MKRGEPLSEGEGETPPEVQLFLPFGRLEEGVNRLLWKAATVEEVEALSEILYEHRREYPSGE